MESSRRDKAVAYFGNGCNCAQAVFTAFADLFGMEEEDAFRVTAALGGGVYGLRDICGAVSGMAMATAMLEGGDGGMASRNASKEMFMPLKDDFADAFRSIMCCDLIESDQPQKATAEWAEKYPERNPRCVAYVAYAAELLECARFYER